jgi:hypothetical protein
MTLGQGEGNTQTSDLLARILDLLLMGLICLHKVCPRAGRVLAVFCTLKWRVLLFLVRAEHVVYGDILQVLSRHLHHASSPTTITPSDYLDGRICLSHGFGKLDCLDRSSFAIEAPSIMGRLVSYLPEGNSQWVFVAV